ncbi:MAG: tetratricopeptide repeat protein [Armatimonas sp.]
MSDLARERGAALLQEGRFTEAAQALHEAVTTNPADENAWRYLGAALGSSGDIPGSVESIRAHCCAQSSFSEESLQLGTGSGADW